MENKREIFVEMCRIIVSIGLALIAFDVLDIVNWSNVVIYIVAILTIVAGLGWVYIGMKKRKS